MTQEESEILQEGALAIAQAVIQRSMFDAGISKKQLAARMNRPLSFVNRMMQGDHNLTVKTFAAALAACDMELQFMTMRRRKRK